MPDLAGERLLAQASRFAASGAAPVPPRLAATVLLLRDAGAGFEVYLLRRAPGMAFAAGRYAFPGGAVEPVDHQGAALEPAWLARLGRPVALARAVVRAAVRELSEETGVRVDAADLVAWSRWITPEFEPRRYDTHFFVTALPDGQLPARRGGEADRTQWIRPADAVARARSGEALMLPPTAVTLAEVARCRTVPEVLAVGAGRDAATAILPRVERGPDGTAHLVGWQR